VFKYVVSASDTSGNVGIRHGTEPVLDHISPTIQDLSGTPTTGDEFLIIANISDNVGIADSQLYYTIQSGTSGEVKGFDHEFRISIPDNAYRIDYDIQVWDFNDNWKYINVKKEVIDNDAPHVKDLTNGTPERARYFHFEAYAEDNRALKTVCVEYWYEDEVLGKCEEEDRDGTLSFKVAVPNEWPELHYIFKAWDSSGNLDTTEERVLTIIGTDPEGIDGPDSPEDPSDPADGPSDTPGAREKEPGIDMDTSRLDTILLVSIPLIILFLIIVFLFSFKRKQRTVVEKENTPSSSDYVIEEGILLLEED
jgi:hypothetical protein